MQEDEIQTEQEVANDRVPFYVIRRTIPLPPIDAEPHYRVSIWMAWFLVMSAIVVDVLELLLSYTGVGIFVATVEAFAAGFIFWLWFKVLGVNYTSNTKSFATSIATYVAELIPGLDLVPFWFAWTVGMMLIITLSRMEDRGEEPTIIGALGRILTFAGGPITMLTKLPLEVYRDRKRVAWRQSEMEKERLELLQNPENEEGIRAKYQERADKFKRRGMSGAERLEKKFFNVGKDGVSLKEGASIDEAKASFGKLRARQQTQSPTGQNVLDLKKGGGGAGLPFKQ